MKLKGNELAPGLVPVLIISTNQTGSHCTVYPVGTKAEDLAHDIDPESGKPTLAEGVYVELVSRGHAAVLGRMGKLCFSSQADFDAWQAGEP